ncbi:MAG: hypothetical protein GY950_25600 [bacterium]|nr:hypothetical protein [bacterium]
MIQNNITGYTGFYVPGSGSGGGIFNLLGEGTLSNCTITDNSTGEHHYREGGGNGGGICNFAELTLTNCIVSHNCTTDTWDETNGGGIENGGTLILTNCTISNNYTGDGKNGADGGSGGGIHNSGTLNLESCTICNNATGTGSIGYLRDGVDGSGGGIYSEAGMVYIKNTIVAGNQVAEGGEGPDCRGTLNSLGYNLIRNTDHATFIGNTTGNITGVDPLLGLLADNGGATQTHALIPGSPAIDAGTNSAVLQDQRGHQRPVDIPGIPNAGDGTDIGAYEFDTSFVVSGRIIYAGTGLAGVILTFSNDGGTISSDADGDYSFEVLYGWSGTVTPSISGYAFTPTSRSYTAVTGAQTAQDFTATPTVPTTLWINRTQLIFGADTSGNQTAPQTFLIANSGGGILNWTINDDAGWLNCTPASGTESVIITATVDPAGLTAGVYYGTITVEAPDAFNSPRTLGVTLTVYDPDDTGGPFGCFETPPEGVTLSGSVPVSGWVLDDIGVEHVKIYRQESSTLVYIGDALFVEGARPDVELAYPGFPENSGAGWGYMMLTNFLPDGGNGTFTLHAVAIDREGHQTTLGTRNVTCDNANAVKPFGAIDTPGQGGTASGNSFRNHGWALTPPPNEIPINGSTIDVYVDGINLGNPVYNVYRSDVANLFPGYANSDGAGGYFDFDTTNYDNGVHTIYWTAVDDAGNADGIGSRYFTIDNTGNPRRGTYEGEQGLDSTPFSSAPVAVKMGYNKNVEPAVSYPGENGIITINIRELERLELHLTPNTQQPVRITGYHVIGEQLRPHPIGSTLDSERGIFYWIPGPGFLGAYQLVFIEERPNGEIINRLVNIKIVPKFSRFRDIK